MRETGFNLNDPELLRTAAFIDGSWVPADDGASYLVTDPACGRTLAGVANCGANETLRAIDAASAALLGWRNTSAKERANSLRRWFELINASCEDLARLLTAEQGKPLAEARGEITYGASYIEWFAEESKRIYGDTIQPGSNNQRLIVLKEPVGVVACITPWNFPNAMLTRKIAPALAAGCTVVCKPAEATPLSAFALAELAQRAGIPRGVINMVTGDPAKIGGVLTRHAQVRKLSFTGSTRVGKQLLADCAGTVKRTSMELGGNAPFVVFEDADIDAAVAGALASKFRNAGQTCVCANRFLVQDSIYERFTSALVAAVNAMTLGRGDEAGVDIGPMINADAADKVIGLINHARTLGARVAAGGRRSKLGSTFVEPTVLTEVTSEMRVCREEIFGPVAPLQRFTTEGDAIALANDTRAGLAAYVYTRDMGRIWRVSDAMEYGIVGVNEGTISNEMAPFGGIKESGHGREGSRYGMDDYLEIKYLCMGGIES